MWNLVSVVGSSVYGKIEEWGIFLAAFSSEREDSRVDECRVGA
jgi:hypothetical protein